MRSPAPPPAPSPRAAAAPGDARRDRWVAGGCAGATVLLALLLAHLRHDDAYITFRYARNLVLGEGLVFNPGQRLLATTTPLYALLLAGVHPLVGGRLEVAAVALGAAALGAQAWLLYTLLRGPLPRFAPIAAAACLLSGFDAHPWLALETNLLAALLLGALAARVRRRPTLCGALLGLAFLCRYDAALFAVVLVAGALAAERRVPLRELVAAAVVAAPWLLFASVHFGSPLPTSLGAKTGWTDAGAYLAFHAGQVLRVPGLGVPRLPAPLALALGALATGAGLDLARRRAPALLALAALGLLYGLAYAWIGPPLDHHWHVYVPRLAGGLLALLGALRAAAWLGRRLGREGLAVAVAGTALCALLAGDAWRLRTLVAEDLWFGERDRRYARVAAWTRRHAQPRPTFLAEEVGTLGYRSDGIMIDPYGIATPLDPRFRARGLGAFPALLRVSRPALFLLDDGEVRCWLESRTGYAVVRVFDWAELTGSRQALHKWSVLAVRGAEVLRDPAALPTLRARAARAGRRCPPRGAPR